MVVPWPPIHFVALCTIQQQEKMSVRTGMQKNRPRIRTNDIGTVLDRSNEVS